MKYIRFGILLSAAAVAALQGCVTENLPECVGGDIELHTRAVGVPGQAPANQSGYANIQFWTKAQFDEMLGGRGATPLYVSQLDNDVDYYAAEGGIIFRTGHPYPDGNAEVYASGFFPGNALDGSGSYYTELVVGNAFRDGLTDFLCSDGRTDVKGSYNDRFIDDDDQAKNETRELKFRHLTAKLLFKGVRSHDMVNAVGVRDVKITLHGSRTADNRNVTELAIPTKFSLYSSDKRFSYIIGDADRKTFDKMELPVSMGTINMGDKKHLDSCYVVSKNLRYGSGAGQFDPFAIAGDDDAKYGIGFGAVNSPGKERPTITIDVEATLFISGDEAESYIATWKNQTVPIEVTDGSVDTGDMLCPGYVYEITIEFNRAGIALKAEAVPWEDGGLHVQPVYPID